ncbi:MAG TPA: YqgE/AlgH family protein [Gammaproteobacteria bacterium]|nr:YqgE/AlgH family protein [Gammaproteobacteria bacterium]
MEALNLTNQFLIAMPTLADPNFSQTVTYICAHSEEGAMGIVINRPMNIALGEVFSQMKMATADPQINSRLVFNGGPVQPDRGFVLHRPMGTWSSNLQVSTEIGVATSRDILEAISKGEGPADALVALGYAGWGAGQLEREMLDNSWLSAPANQDILFRLSPEDRWQAAVALLGIRADSLSTEAGHA